MGNVVMGGVDPKSPSRAKRKRGKIPDINLIEPEQVQSWLQRGFEDFKNNPLTSFLYGSLAVIGCYLIMMMTREVPALGLSFLSGLLMLGPFLGIGLYDAARSKELGKPVTAMSTLRAMKSNALSIGLLAVFLAVLMIAWLRLSTLLVALNVRSPGMGFEFLSAEVFRLDNIVWLSLYMLIGFIFVAAAFITNCIALPMILDRSTDTVTAVITSVRAVNANREPMMLWAALIVGLSIFGLLTLFLGFAVIFPVLGYATWHSYRDLVDRED